MRHRPRKRFGQNFLADRSVVAAIVAAIAPHPADRVVEIGPGLGALTRPLAERLAHLHAIEIDRDIVARLRAEFPPARVTVHQGDALRFDFSALGPGLRVVGNLPYNISTPLLFHLARHAGAIRDIHVMLQREVVERMIAAPASPRYGRLSVMLQYRFRMERVLVVPARAFRPVPAVESAVVRMVPLAPLPYPARDEQRFALLVRAAFSQRRKTLRNALRGVATAQALAALGVDPGARPETLTVEQFVRIANACLGHGSG
jgi:16S rRNA (adenine1518-N6/adenine1519-N6)-dimethyltransferase